MVQRLRETWKTTDPEDPEKQTVRFLGMEVTVVRENGEKVWKVTQENVKDMLGEEGWLKARKIPITKNQSMDELILEENISADKIRGAQKIVCEMLWLVTRTRPDVNGLHGDQGANESSGDREPGEGLLEVDHERRSSLHLQRQRCLGGVHRCLICPRGR